MSAFYNGTSDILYEDDIATLPSAPDVSNYLISEVTFEEMDVNPTVPTVHRGTNFAKRKGKWISFCT
ncbi:hypothetical protein QJS04_geneDACA000514 [Acorus gramineus]|uniref:Uncharacterized protein n=1 Tax=Acorus gramineus TaxID=55184 RepID=A0AAV9AQZ6_ACOGR|nr:hypothetical protein QJS04_geneDACA000514 [Acorus gramineus]